MKILILNESKISAVQFVTEKNNAENLRKRCSELELSISFIKFPLYRFPELNEHCPEIFR